MHGCGTLEPRGATRPTGAANRELRQQLAARTDEGARIGEKLQAAKTRIEALLKQIPETET